MKRDIAAVLRAHGVQPSAQRLAVAAYVLDTDEHPSAEEVLYQAKARLPMISRATVYNTLNLFVEKGLMRELVLAEGRMRLRLQPRRRTTTSSTTRPAPSTTCRGRRCASPTSTGWPASRSSEYMVVLRGKKAQRPRRQARAPLLRHFFVAAHLDHI